MAHGQHHVSPGVTTGMPHVRVSAVTNCLNVPYDMMTASHGRQFNSRGDDGGQRVDYDGLFLDLQPIEANGDGTKLHKVGFRRTES